MDLRDNLMIRKIELGVTLNIRVSGGVKDNFVGFWIEQLSKY